MSGGAVNAGGPMSSPMGGGWGTSPMSNTAGAQMPQPGAGGWGMSPSGVSAGGGAYRPINGYPGAGPGMPTGGPQQPNQPLTPTNMPTMNPQQPNQPLTPAGNTPYGPLTPPPAGLQPANQLGNWGQGQGPYSGYGAGQMNFPQVNFGGLGSMLGAGGLNGMSLGGK